MNVLRSLSEWPGDMACGGLAIGVFDGVHKGHQSVISRLLNVSSGLPACVLTFEPHPLLALGKTPPPFLLSFAQKSEMLRNMGVHTLFALPFTEEFAGIGHEMFSRRLWEACRPAHVVVGQDFHYGSGASGNVRTLSEEGSLIGFKAIGVPNVELDGVTVSSTTIRRLIQQGDMRGAARMMGRPFTVRGTVIPGDGRGKRLGFATANIVPPEGQVLPPRGVYASTVAVSGTTHKSVLNIGIRPTFAPGKASIEVHLIEFEASLYGETLDVSFIEFLRPEIRFASPFLLTAQVNKDRARALDILANKMGLVYNT